MYVLARREFTPVIHHLHNNLDVLLYLLGIHIVIRCHIITLLHGFYRQASPCRLATFQSTKSSQLYRQNYNLQEIHQVCLTVDQATSSCLSFRSFCLSSNTSRGTSNALARMLGSFLSRCDSIAVLGIGALSMISSNLIEPDSTSVWDISSEIAFTAGIA